MTTINVTAEDIEQGEPCEGDACPIRLAANRVLKPGVTCSVAFSYMTLTSEGYASRIDLPKPAKEFIEAYDDDGIGIPFSFSLDIPERFLRRAEQ